MWNSPHSPSRSGKRYAPADLTALILPIDQLLDRSTSEPVSDLVEEKILQRLDRGEFLFALHEVFEALTSDKPVPDRGHPGIHEAIIAELLYQAFDLVECEMEMGDVGELAREAVWRSVDRLLIHRDPHEPALPWILEDDGMTLEDPDSYRVEQLTLEHWQALLCGEGGLFGEFLWDVDWRMDSLMDLPPDTAKFISGMAGLDLEVVQALPHTPDAAEVQRAEESLWKLVKELATEDRDPCRDEAEAGWEGDDEIPF
jgi:hypothetical protein